MSSNGEFPNKADLEKAIIKALKNLGGEGTVMQINKQVINILQLPDEIVTMEDDSGLGTKLNYRLRWCRTNLKNAGKIENISRGTWKLLVD